MTELNYQDWQTLISAIGALHADFDPQSLPERALAAASKIIPAADSVAFTGFRHNAVDENLVWDTTVGFSPAEMEIFSTYIHESPLFTAFFLENRTETLRISDLMAKREFERTAIYNEFYRVVGVSTQLVAPMRISDELLITCSMNIKNSDFSQRDKQVLSLLAPHIANAIGSGFAYQRLSAALDTEGCGIVTLNSKGQPVFVSEYARQLLGRYFAGEKPEVNGLPESLKDWIRLINLPAESNAFHLPSRSLKIVAENGELTARLVYNKQTGERTLMLEEKRYHSPEIFLKLGLTGREAEVLWWITQGKSDQIIARLCGISPRTVQKHVQHLYTKLGVETRTAAMLKALEAVE